MGRALTRPASEADGTFYHPASSTRFTIRANGSTVFQTIERAGLQAEYPVDYVIGSGQHAKGYLIRLGEHLFQSPIAFDRRTAQYDMAPGYERFSRPDVNRRASAECLGCHASGTGGQLVAITCDRCHGSTAEHLRRPDRSTIINPARLPASQRNSVCEQCHLHGEARVPRPGQDFSGFQPGAALEDHWSVFVYDRPRDDLRVVSHAEQLALSLCARGSSGRLWCGSCHQPHGSPVSIDAQCRNCHAPAGLTLHAKTENCAGCHMPKRPASDGGHTAFTDHRIRRLASAPFASPAPAAVNTIRPWRDSGDAALRQRNLGLASIIVGERDGSAALINDGYRHLASGYPKFPRDPDVLASLGMVLYLKDQYADAAKTLRAAVAVRPNDATLHEKLAVVLQSAGDRAGAAQELERAIALDPFRETSYHLLAQLQTTPEARRGVLERLLERMPRSIVTREALRDLRLARPGNLRQQPPNEIILRK